MKSKLPVPESIRKQMQKAGRARAAMMTPEDRSAYGRKAWQTRIENEIKRAKPISPATTDGG